MLIIAQIDVDPVPALVAGKVRRSFAKRSHMPARAQSKRLVERSVNAAHGDSNT